MSRTQAVNWTRSTVKDRVMYLLRGRKMARWSAAVGLEREKARRLAHGKVPVADSLTGPARVENLSLTWLLSGEGRPFLTFSPLNAEDAADHIDVLLGEEDDWRPLVVASPQGWSVVLHQPAETVGHDKKPIRYEAVAIIGGLHQDRILVDRALDARDNCQLLLMKSQDAKRLFTGYMGTTELFGLLDEPGLADHAVPFSWDGFQAGTSKAIDDSAPEDRISSSERETVRQLRALDSSERKVVLRMIKGLHDSKP